MNDSILSRSVQNFQKPSNKLKKKVIVTSHTKALNKLNISQIYQNSINDNDIFENEIEHTNNQFITVFNIDKELKTAQNYEGIKLRNSIVSFQNNLDRSVDKIQLGNQRSSYLVKNDQLLQKIEEGMSVRKQINQQKTRSPEFNQKSSSALSLNRIRSSKIKSKKQSKAKIDKKSKQKDVNSNKIITIEINLDEIKVKQELKEIQEINLEQEQIKTKETQLKVQQKISQEIQFEEQQKILQTQKNSNQQNQNEQQSNFSPEKPHQNDIEHKNQEKDLKKFLHQDIDLFSQNYSEKEYLTQKKKSALQLQALDKKKVSFSEIENDIKVMEPDFQEVQKDISIEQLKGDIIPQKMIAEIGQPIQNSGQNLSLIAEDTALNLLQSEGKIDNETFLKMINIKKQIQVVDKEIQNLLIQQKKLSLNAISEQQNLNGSMISVRQNQRQSQNNLNVFSQSFDLRSQSHKNLKNELSFIDNTENQSFRNHYQSRSLNKSFAYRSASLNQSFGDVDNEQIHNKILQQIEQQYTLKLKLFVESAQHSEIQRQKIEIDSKLQCLKAYKYNLDKNLRLLRVKFVKNTTEMRSKDLAIKNKKEHIDKMLDVQDQNYTIIQLRKHQYLNDKIQMKSIVDQQKEMQLQQKKQQIENLKNQKMNAFMRQKSLQELKQQQLIEQKEKLKEKRKQIDEYTKELESKLKQFQSLSQEQQAKLKLSKISTMKEPKEKKQMKNKMNEEMNLSFKQDTSNKKILNFAAPKATINLQVIKEEQGLANRKQIDKVSLSQHRSNSARVSFKMNQIKQQLSSSFRKNIESEFNVDQEQKQPSQFNPRYSSRQSNFIEKNKNIMSIQIPNFKNLQFQKYRQISTQILQKKIYPELSQNKDFFEKTESQIKSKISKAFNNTSLQAFNQTVVQDIQKHALKQNQILKRKNKNIKSIFSQLKEENKLYNQISYNLNSDTQRQQQNENDFKAFINNKTESLQRTVNKEFIDEHNLFLKLENIEKVQENAYNDDELRINNMSQNIQDDQFQNWENNSRQLNNERPQSRMLEHFQRKKYNINQNNHSYTQAQTNFDHRDIAQLSFGNEQDQKQKNEQKFVTEDTNEVIDNLISKIKKINHQNSNKRNLSIY